MKLLEPHNNTHPQTLFHVGVKCLVDRGINTLALLNISHILSEESKLRNMRNGKVYVKKEAANSKKQQV